MENMELICDNGYTYVTFSSHHDSQQYQEYIGYHDSNRYRLDLKAVYNFKYQVVYTLWKWLQ